MPQDTYYVRLFNNNQPTSPILYASSFPVLPAGDNGRQINVYSQPGSYYDFFLYNKNKSGKIIKIKDYFFDNTVNSKAPGSFNIYCSRATTIGTGSNNIYSIPILKTNSNSPDLPSSISYWTAPVSWTNTGSFFKNKTLKINNNTNDYNTNSGFRLDNSSRPTEKFRTSQLLSSYGASNNLQKITLRPGENFIIGITGSGGGTYGASSGNYKFINNITIKSGSDTYYIYDEMVGGGGWTFSLGGLVNNSNTNIEIIDINIDALYKGITIWDGTIAGDSINGTAYAIKSIFIEKVNSINDPILDNPIYQNITSLDSNATSSIENILCYKNCIYMDEWDGGANISNYFYRWRPLNNIFKINNIIKSTSTAISPTLETDNRYPLSLNDHTKTRINYNRSGNELILYPGQGLGFTMLEGLSTSTSPGYGDVTLDGHVTFTVEDIPTTPTGSAYQEIGFGF